jgi:hypothetical protein
MGRKRVLSPEQEAQIVQAHAEGLGIKRLVRKFGLGFSLIVRTLRRAPRPTKALPGSPPRKALPSPGILALPDSPGVRCEARQAGVWHLRILLQARPGVGETSDLSGPVLPLQLGHSACRGSCRWYGWPGALRSLLAGPAGRYLGRDRAGVEQTTGGEKARFQGACTHGERARLAGGMMASASNQAGASL